MEKKFISLLIICFAMVSNSCAESLNFKGLNEAQSAIESALNLISQDKAEEGLAGLIPYFPIEEDVLEQLLNELSGGHNAAMQALGNPVGFNFVGIRDLKDVIVEVTYLERFEKSVLRWRFYLYKSLSLQTWTFHSIQMDGDIPAAMNEWGKIASS